jgi:hypothetical protein
MVIKAIFYTADNSILIAFGLVKGFIGVILIGFKNFVDSIEPKANQYCNR